MESNSNSSTRTGVSTEKESELLLAKQDKQAQESSTLKFVPLKAAEKKNDEDQKAKDMDSCTSGTPFLGLVPPKFRILCLISALDFSVTTAVCRDVFLGSCLTSVSPRLVLFLGVRLILVALTMYGVHCNTQFTSRFLLIFLIQTFVQLVYTTSVVFSKEWGGYDIILSCITSTMFVSAQLYFLTKLQIDYEKKKTKTEWRQLMKQRGKTTALERDLEREKENEEADYFKLMWQLLTYFRPRGRVLAYTAFGVIGMITCSTVKPLVYTSMLDALVSKDWDLIKLRLKQYFIVLLVENVFHWIQAYYQRVSRELVRKDLKKMAYKKCLAMECGYFDPLSTGEIMSTVWHNVGSVTSSLGWHLRCLLEFFVKTCMIICIIFTLNYRLAFCACIIAPIIECGLRYFNEHCKRLAQLNRDNWTAVEKMITESISNIRTVKVFGCEAYEFSLFSELIDEVFDIVLQEVYYCEARWTFCNFVPQISKFILMYYSVCLVLEDQISFGDMAAFMVYQGHISWIFHTCAEQLTRISELMILSHKVFKLFDRDCELMRAVPGLAPKHCQGKIELKNVTFSYPTKKESDVLHDISLTVNPGEVVALVGHSGCGKTTIVKLMSYLYGPHTGSVTLDGIPVGDYTSEDFSKKVVCVPQEPVLFARSLHDNIAYGVDLTREQVIKAAKQANAHEFIIKQPQGYDSVVGERGITLSGGQRQRICIARALARKPNVLLLDEATASLDSKSEHLVHKAIDDIIFGDERQMSLVIVAHRLSTVKNADRIFVIEEGRIVEVGSHVELMHANGPYASFVEQQLLAEKEDDTGHCRKEKRKTQRDLIGSASA